MTIHMFYFEDTYLMYHRLNTFRRWFCYQNINHITKLSRWLSMQDSLPKHVVRAIYVMIFQLIQKHRILSPIVMKSALKIVLFHGGGNHSTLKCSVQPIHCVQALVRSSGGLSDLWSRSAILQKRGKFFSKLMSWIPHLKTHAIHLCHSRDAYIV